MRKLLFTAVFIFASTSAALNASAGDSPEMRAKKGRAEADAAEITEMRSSLAKSFIKPDMEITEDTFKKVCGAVGARLKELAQRDSFTIRHAAIKNRNPRHAAAPDEAALINRFASEKGLKEVWDTVETGGKKLVRYTRPIYVEDACLACHGPKEKRPAFISAKYPEDKAFGFKTGDLRGTISVSFPAE